MTQSNVIWIRNPLATYGIDANSDGSAQNVSGIILGDGQIQKILYQGEDWIGDYDEAIDASRLVVLPGLINTHHHFYQTLTRAMRIALNKPLFQWLGALYPLWANLTEADVEIATRLAIAELMLSGCTTSVDHHYLFTENCRNAIDVQMQVAIEMGMRTVLTRGSMSLDQSSGGLPPTSVVEDEDTILFESERLIKKWHDASDFALGQIALAPCSPFSVTPQLMRATAEISNKSGVALHTHLAETEDEVAFCLEKYGVRPIEFLDDCDWLTPNAWFAHSIHLTQQEISLLGARQCSVSHCPSSNMVLSSGVCKVKELTAAGVSVGLAVDGSASNDHSNLIQETRQAFLLQRLFNSDFTHLDALRMATLGGSEVLSRPVLGHLNIGAAADLAMFDLQDIQFSGAQDPLAALLSSGAHRAHHVLINGVWRVKEGHLTDIDEANLVERHHSQAQKMWQRAGLY